MYKLVNNVIITWTRNTIASKRKINFGRVSNSEEIEDTGVSLSYTVNRGEETEKGRQRITKHILLILLAFSCQTAVSKSEVEVVSSELRL